MAVDEDTWQLLHLLRTSRGIALREEANGELRLERTTSIADGPGRYWVPGSTTLASGRTLDSVFVVDADDAGTVLRTFWAIEPDWHEAADEDVPALLGLSAEEIHPFSWTYAIPLDVDVSVDGQPVRHAEA